MIWKCYGIGLMFKLSLDYKENERRRELLVEKSKLIFKGDKYIFLVFLFLKLYNIYY